MKTLPDQPTAEMLEAGATVKTWGDADLPGAGLAKAIYRAMYDAAPDTSAEPVAWIIGENPNAWATLRRDLLSSVKPGTKVTPLYTHPAPSPDHEPMVQIQALGPGQ